MFILRSRISEDLLVHIRKIEGLGINEQRQVHVGLFNLFIDVMWWSLVAPFKSNARHHAALTTNISLDEVFESTRRLSLLLLLRLVLLDLRRRARFLFRFRTSRLTSFTCDFLLERRVILTCQAHSRQLMRRNGHAWRIGHRHHRRRFDQTGRGRPHEVILRADRVLFGSVRQG